MTKQKTLPVNSKSSNKTIRCNYCDYITTSTNMLIRHKRSHSNKVKLYYL